MKKMLHVGILSFGLMLSHAALADEFADLRNNPNNMTAEQAKQVEAGSWGRVVWNGTKEFSKRIGNWSKNNPIKATVATEVGINAGGQFFSGEQCRDESSR